MEVAVDGELLHGRYRIEDGQLVLEWRGGRDCMGCGLVRPEVLAEHLLRVHGEDEVEGGLAV